MWGEELGLIGDTGKNLDAAAHGENYEWTDMYEDFAKRRSRKALRRLQRDFAWLARLRKCMKSGTGSSCGMCRYRRCLRKSSVKVWECRNCGHIVVGTSAPKVCPACHYPQGYYEVREDVGSVEVSGDL